MKEREIKVVITYTEGYERRYTEACLEQISLMSEEELEQRLREVEQRSREKEK